MDFAENPLELFLLLSGVPGRENRAGEKRETVIPAMGGFAGGEGARRRLGARGGGARGGRELPREVLGAAGGGRR